MRKMKHCCASFLVFLLSCGTAGYVELTIAGEGSIVPDEVDRLFIAYRFYSEGEGSEVMTEGYEVETLPQTVVVERGDSYDYGVSFTVNGYKGDTWKIVKHTSALFPSEGAEEALITLEAECLDKECGVSEHCELRDGAGKCVNNENPGFPE